MVLSELLLHGQYQSFVVCKMGDCLLRRNREFRKKRALLAYSSGKISSTQPAVRCPFASGWVREFTHTPSRITYGSHRMPVTGYSTSRDGGDRICQTSVWICKEQ